jgi:hypothetical protein
MFEAARQPEQYGYMAANANPPAFARLAGSRAKRGHIGRIMLTPQTPGRQPWFWTITARAVGFRTRRLYFRGQTPGGQTITS